jgi:fatty-acyl-CoA synthase
MNLMQDNPYAVGLGKNEANFQPLTPLGFLSRAAQVFPGHPAVVHGAQRFSYAEYYARARRLASALSRRGIGEGHTVSVMLANTPPMLEAHYGVPMVRAVLHSINTRLDAAVIAFMLDHAESRVVIVDREFVPVMREALRLAKAEPLLIEYADPTLARTEETLGGEDYEAFLAGGDPEFA